MSNFYTCVTHICIVTKQQRSSHPSIQTGKHHFSFTFQTISKILFQWHAHCLNILSRSTSITNNITATGGPVFSPRFAHNKYRKNQWVCIGLSYNGHGPPLVYRIPGVGPQQNKKVIQFINMAGAMDNRTEALINISPTIKNPSCGNCINNGWMKAMKPERPL